MTTWTTATRACRCGACGRLIRIGDDLVVKQLPEVKRQLLRCADCAEDPAPIPPPQGEALTR